MENNANLFDATTQKTNEWIWDVAMTLEIANKQEAYRVLRCVLQAWRDQIGPDEAAQFSAQLPMLLRGAYYEAWNPSGAHHVRTVEEFRELVLRYHAARPYRHPDEMVRAVCRTAKRHMDGNEVDQALGRLPDPIRRLFVGDEAIII